MPTLSSRKRKSLKQRLKEKVITHYEIATALFIGAVYLALFFGMVFFIFLAILTVFA